jgi:YVTN family beta-propeller protein
MRRFASLALLCGLACAACAPVGRSPAVRLDLPADAGALYVYLEPWAPEMRVTLALAGVEAVRDDGTATPLELSAGTLAPPDVSRERLLARGVVSGVYSAIRLTLAGATLREGGRDVPLQVTSQAVVVPVALNVGSGQGAVVRLALAPGGVVPGGYQYKPAFVATIPPRPALGLLGLVTCPGDGALLLLDKQSGSVTGVVPVGRGPLGVDADRVERRAFVALSGGDALTGVDLERSVVALRRALRGGDEPVALRVTLDRRTLLVVNRGSSSLAFVDPASLAELDRVTVGTGPEDLAVDRTGSRAYVLNGQASSITIVDIAKRAVAGTIGVESGPRRARFNRAEDRLWVLHDGSPYLVAVDLRSLSVVRRIQVAGGASALLVDPRDDRLYAARRDGSGIEIFESASDLAVDFIPFAEGRIDELVLDVEANALLAVSESRGSLHAIRLAGRKPAWSADVPGAARLSLLAAH